MDWIIDNGPTLILSIVALAVSIKSWYKSRVFYDIEIFEISGRMNYDLLSESPEIKQKLSTGKYTILNTFEDRRFVTTKDEKAVFIILGKIKK